ncbi:hypothetical protein CBR_g22079 [Chara braunii]|uniref:Uncharacterized protein n=1 Tax=Chara braunii TaxID=69332 RepID=A0A388L274_CHABU|nr:hypothetical protein CBR_g22079 [Chara braunii]|eukprot:GBG76332.1 hypothetical protein CBR_g22079 [Chara braunii]
MEPVPSTDPASSLLSGDMVSPADMVDVYKQQIGEAIEAVLQAEGKLPLMILREVDDTILEWRDVLQQIASSVPGTLQEEPVTSALQGCFLHLEDLQQITAQQLAAIAIANLAVDGCCSAALGVWEETDGGPAPPLPTSADEIFVEGQDLSAALGPEGDNCLDQPYIIDTDNDAAVAPANNDNNNNTVTGNNNNNNNINNNGNRMAANEDDGGRQSNGRWSPPAHDDRDGVEEGAHRSPSAHTDRPGDGKGAHRSPPPGGSIAMDIDRDARDDGGGEETTTVMATVLHDRVMVLS